MKKTLIIIISLVYIASIVVVNFFGLEIKVFDGVTYVEKISCADVKLLHEIPITIEPTYFASYGETPWFVFDFVPNANGTEYTDDPTSVQTNPNAVHVEYEIFPHTANERSVDFIFDKDAYANRVIFDDLKNTFIFLKPKTSVLVTMKSKDGSNKSTSFYIYCK